MSVADQLPRLIVGRSKAQTQDHIVQTALKLSQQVFAGNSFMPGRLLEIRTKLVFENAIDPFYFLLLAKLQAISDDLCLAIPPVLSRREVSFLDGAGRLEAAFTFEEQLHSFSAAQTAYRSCVSSQINFSLLPSDENWELRIGQI